MSDLDIERLAKHVGGAAARRLDTDRVVERVLGRLRDAPPSHEHAPSPRRKTRWLQAAAAMAVLVIGSWVARTVLVPPPSQTAFPVPLAWEALEADEWTEVLDSLTHHAPVHDYVATATLYDLTEDQLRELLNQLES